MRGGVFASRSRRIADLLVCPDRERKVGGRRKQKRENSRDQPEFDCRDAALVAPEMARQDGKARRWRPVCHSTGLPVVPGGGRNPGTTNDPQLVPKLDPPEKLTVRAINCRQPPPVELPPLYDTCCVGK
jgi:hypothetical protein